MIAVKMLERLQKNTNVLVLFAERVKAVIPFSASFVEVRLWY